MKTLQLIKQLFWYPFKDFLKLNLSILLCCFLILKVQGVVVANETVGYLLNDIEKIEEVQQEISGLITDNMGSPLPGVNIIIKGTKSGTQAGIDGRYTINASKGDVLEFSFVGMQTANITVEAKTTIDVVLQYAENTLDEVVVVGYGTMKKSDVTGALSSVNSKDFDQQPLTTISEALQGRASGVAVNQTSGAPGAGYKIRIRGANSISGSNNPLYVVDGLIVSDINSINVNDIKAMEVLKDASSTAIYGSRGANGVVLITTKSGRSGKAKVEVDYFYRMSNVSQKIGMMTPAQFAEGVNFAEGKVIYTPEAIAGLENEGGQDWQDTLFQKAKAYNLQLAFSGGGENIDYYISGNYNDQEGTVVSQQYKRYGVRANVNAKVSEKIKVGMNTFLSRAENTGVSAGLAGGLTWDPTTPAFNEDGDYNFSPLIPGVGNGVANPLIAPQNNIRENYNNQVVANTYFNYDILENLVLNISGGVENNQINNNGYISILSNGTGTATVLNRNVNRLQNTNRLTYTLDKNPKHRLQVDAIYEIQKITTAWTEAESTGFFSDGTTYKNLALGQLQRTDNLSTSEGLQSVLGRLNYSLLNKYLFTASVRSDGSSKFQDQNQWGVFPSGSFAWRMSEENFMKDSKVINDLKIRVSYGVTGSQAIEPLATRSIPIIDPNINYPFTGGAATVGVAPSNRLANPDLTWETTNQGDIGFDLSLWNSKITLNFDMYKKLTSNLLLDRILPSYVGPTVVAQNVGEVENKGFEFTLGWNVFTNEDWHVGSTLTFSKNNNKVLSLIDGQDSMELGNNYFGGTFPVNPTIVKVGLPISSFVGYIFEGVYQLGEEAEGIPGQAKYKDVSGPEGVPDGLITTDDITVVGNGNPDFTWGWNWSASWKNIDLNMVFLGSQGNDIYNFTRLRMMGNGATQFHAVHEDYLDRWSPTNPSNIPNDRDSTQDLSTQWLEDGSFVSLKSLAIGYTFTDVSKKIGLDDVRLYLSAENLFIITNYTGFDPESTATGNSDVDLGIDYNAYPINQSFTFGLNMTF